MEQSGFERWANESHLNVQQILPVLVKFCHQPWYFCRYQIRFISLALFLHLKDVTMSIHFFYYGNYQIGLVFRNNIFPVYNVICSCSDELTAEAGCKAMLSRCHYLKLVFPN